MKEDSELEFKLTPLQRCLDALVAWPVNVTKEGVLIIAGTLYKYEKRYQVGGDLHHLTFTLDLVCRIQLLPNRPALIEVF